MTASHDDIKAYLLGLLRRKGDLPAEFSDSTDFLDDGIVDSIGIIKFVLDIECRFGIEMHDSDIEDIQFRTIGGLCSMIQRKHAMACP